MIKFHYTYLIMALGFVLTGYYLNLIVFTSLIVVHELGHYFTARLMKFNVKKIIIYPYGGITKLDDIINKNINKELLISVAGIITQLVFFFIIVKLYKYGLVRNYTMKLFYEYNRQIIIFNLLPIYPLDGSKIITLLINKILNYNLSNYITVVISMVTLLFVLVQDIYTNNYTTFMSIVILLNYIYDFCKKIKYYYYKFLLERYLYHISYDKVSVVGSGNKFYRDRSHIVKYNNYYMGENEYLQKIFSKY